MDLFGIAIAAWSVIGLTIVFLCSLLFDFNQIRHNGTKIAIIAVSGPLVWLLSILLLYWRISTQREKR